MQIRPATLPDVTRMHEGAAPFSARALVIEDGAEMGIAGVYYCQGQVIAFSASTDGLRKRAKVKLARAAQALIAAIRAPVFAIEDDYETAPGLLSGSGFQHLGNKIWIRPWLG